jgi:hypothetical protein
LSGCYVLSTFLTFYRGPARAGYPFYRIAGLGHKRQQPHRNTAGNRKKQNEFFGDHIVKTKVGVKSYTTGSKMLKLFNRFCQMRPTLPIFAAFKQRP